MKRLDLPQLERHRDRSPNVARVMGTIGDHAMGVFSVPTRHHAYCMRVIASTGDGWDHVSVSLPDRCPTWEEMEHIKRLFFKEDETAMQLHVPPADHVNHHPNCLHLWRPTDREIPRPAKEFVGAPR